MRAEPLPKTSHGFAYFISNALPNRGRKGAGSDHQFDSDLKVSAEAIIGWLLL